MVHSPSTPGLGMRTVSAFIPCPCKGSPGHPRQRPPPPLGFRGQGGLQALDPQWLLAWVPPPLTGPAGGLEARSPVCPSVQPSIRPSVHLCSPFPSFCLELLLPQPPLPTPASGKEVFPLPSPLGSGGLRGGSFTSENQALSAPPGALPCVQVTGIPAPCGRSLHLSLCPSTH